jgi:hypothetical protein
MQWQWYSGPNCSGALDAHSIGLVPGPDWSLASQDISSPPGAGSARVAIFAIRNESEGTYAFNVDDPFFGPAPTNAPVSVPGTSTLGVAVLCGLIAGVAVIALRRAERSRA